MAKNGIQDNDVAPRAGLLDRTWGGLVRAFRGGAGAGPVAADLPESEIGQIAHRIDECLASRGGEVSARARAADLGRTYLLLNRAGRERFLRLLATHYDIDRVALDEAAEHYLQAVDPARQRSAERRLRGALEPPRVKLLTQFNALPQGVKFLVDMRADLLAIADKDDDLRGLDRDLRDLLASWFDIGFLSLQRITWEGASAALLEKLIAYEAVHEIRSWRDLKNRLGLDRRCYAFFHPSMPDEPLIFVQVALVNGMADNVQVLLDEAMPDADPAAMDTAIFYSISNAQAGLARVSFGNFLIKRVVDHLARDLPNIRTFATLSPIPGFRGWLDGALAESKDDLFSAVEARELVGAAGIDSADAACRALLGRSDWSADSKVAGALRAPLLRLAAHYLTKEKAGARPRDPVARFHLSNGARLERLNWLGDISAPGLRQSAGMMVNYLYKLSDIERNHEAYSGQGRISASSALRRLAQG